MKSMKNILNGAIILHKLKGGQKDFSQVIEIYVFPLISKIVDILMIKMKSCYC